MITKEGPKVIEYNCRFGDPEAQTVLPLMKSSLLDAMLACETGELERTPVEFSNEAAANVVLVSGGYPGKYAKGLPIRIVHAGTAKTEEGFVTAGGRVINVVSVAPTLREAVETAYRETAKVSFENMYMRRDIGRAALEASEDKNK